MVEYALSLDFIFGCLADPTRRDILRRVAGQELSVSQIARPYDLTFSAVSKHLKILEHAQLITKRKRGKQHLVKLAPQALAPAAEYLGAYRQLWEGRLELLEVYLTEDQ